MAGEPRDRDPGGQLVPNDEPRVVVEIRLAGGREGLRLRAEQARVIREVTTWLIENRSNGGQRPAA